MATEQELTLHHTEDKTRTSSHNQQSRSPTKELQGDQLQQQAEQGEQLETGLGEVHAGQAKEASKQQAGQARESPEQQAGQARESPEQQAGQAREASKQQAGQAREAPEEQAGHQPEEQSELEAEQEELTAEQENQTDEAIQSKEDKTEQDEESCSTLIGAGGLPAILLIIANSIFLPTVPESAIYPLGQNEAVFLHEFDPFYVSNVTFYSRTDLIKIYQIPCNELKTYNISLAGIIPFENLTSNTTHLITAHYLGSGSRIEFRFNFKTTKNILQRGCTAVLYLFDELTLYLTFLLSGTTSGAIDSICFEYRGMLNFTLESSNPGYYFVGLYVPPLSNIDYLYVIVLGTEIHYNISGHEMECEIRPFPRPDPCMLEFESSNPNFGKTNICVLGENPVLPFNKTFAFTFFSAASRGYVLVVYVAMTIIVLVWITAGGSIAVTLNIRSICHFCKKQLKLLTTRELQGDQLEHQAEQGEQLETGLGEPHTGQAREASEFQAGHQPEEQSELEVEQEELTAGQENQSDEATQSKGDKTEQEEESCCTKVCTCAVVFKTIATLIGSGGLSAILLIIANSIFLPTVPESAIYQLGQNEAVFLHEFDPFYVSNVTFYSRTDLIKIYQIPCNELKTYNISLAGIIPFENLTSNTTHLITAHYLGSGSQIEFRFNFTTAEDTLRRGCTAVLYLFDELIWILNFLLSGTTSGAIDSICFEHGGVVNFTLEPSNPGYYFVGLYIPLLSNIDYLYVIVLGTEIHYNISGHEMECEIRPFFGQDSCMLEFESPHPNFAETKICILGENPVLPFNKTFALTFFIAASRGYVLTVYLAMTGVAVAGIIVGAIIAIILNIRSISQYCKKLLKN